MNSTFLTGVSSTAEKLAHASNIESREWKSPDVGVLSADIVKRDQFQKINRLRSFDGYMKTKDVKKWFGSLMTQVLKNRPRDPVTFLMNHLKEPSTPAQLKAVSQKYNPPVDYHNEAEEKFNEMEKADGLITYSSEIKHKLGQWGLGDNTKNPPFVGILDDDVLAQHEWYEYFYGELMSLEEPDALTASTDADITAVITSYSASKSDVSAAQKMFDQFMTKDGLITFYELKTKLAKWGQQKDINRYLKREVLADGVVAKHEWFEFYFSAILELKARAPQAAPSTAEDIQRIIYNCGVTDEDVEEAEKYFKHIDKSGDGLLSVAELKMMLIELGVGSDPQEYVKNRTLHDKGYLSRHEWYEFYFSEVLGSDLDLGALDLET